jgi:hypothetical protein
VDCLSPWVSTVQLLSTLVLVLKYEYELNCQGVHHVNSDYTFFDIALSFDRFGSISLNFVLFLYNSPFRFYIYLLHFQLFEPDHHCRDLSSQIAHLVNQNFECISFIF